jgi:hypothetical protein
MMSHRLASLAAGLAAAAALAGEAVANIAGTYPNDAYGVTYLSSERGPCRARKSMVVALDAQGTFIAGGCYGVHNTSIVILWHGGPATVVRARVVTWADGAAPPPPTDDTPRTTL